MIWAQLPRVKKAVGVDFDQVAINVADGIRKKLGLSTSEVQFHSYDLNTQDQNPLDLLLQYGADEDSRYDIISLFSINMWIDDPASVIAWAVDHAHTVLLEINGNYIQQEAAIDALKAKCPHAVEKTNLVKCPDCWGRYRSGARWLRRLFTCDNARAIADESPELAYSLHVGTEPHKYAFG